MAQHPTTATFAEFARIAGFKRGYITQLRKDDRLVLEGRRVRVAESLALIAETSDPAKRGVSDRHARARQETAPSAPAEPANDANAVAPASDDTEADVVAQFDGNFQHWRARNERAKALAAERENLVAEGRLLEAADVAHTVAGGVTTLRARLEALPSMLAPQLAGMDDESAIRVAMAEAIEHALTECARSLQALGAETAA